MKKLKVIFLMIISIALVTSIVSASFLIVTNLNQKIEVPSLPVDSNSKKVVTFIEDGQVIKTMQVDNGYQIKNEDLPKTIEFDRREKSDEWTASRYKWYDYYRNYTWIDANGLSALNYKVNSNVNFTSSVSESKIHIGTSYSEPGNSNSDCGAANNNTINLKNEVINKNQAFNFQIDGDTTNYSPTDSDVFKESGKDSYIGLSDNNISNKVVLENDLRILGSMTIGGRTGYYGPDAGNPANKGQTQLNYQGYLIGDFCQLDLNGKTLIVQNGGMLDLWGSVIDSVGTGKIILESGATLYSPLVVEDMYREDSMPVSYFNNDAVFTMFRMPYLDCKIQIEPGAKVYSKYRISLGSSGTASGDIFLIGGSGSGAFIEISSKEGIDGYLERSTYVNSSLTTNTFIISNDLNKKYRYEAHNLNINMNEILFNFDYSSMNFDIHFGKTQFWIPPYFDFALYNSILVVKQFLIFMPGVNFYVDSNSEIYLSHGLVGTQNTVSFAGSTLFSSQSWHSVGGLLFLDKMYLKDTTKSILDLAKGTNTNKEWYGSLIYYGDNVKSFWLGLEAAKCDVVGKITFDDNISDLYHNYMLGGNINITNVSGFKQEVESNNNVRLYAKAYETGPNMVNYSGGILGIGSTWTRKLNVCAYYTLPLISNGYVLMDPTNCNSNELTDKTYQYNSTENIITGNNSIFIFVFNNQTNNNLYRCKDSNLADSLDGSYISIQNYDMTNHIAYFNNQSYICFQGNFIVVDNNLSGSIAKFCGEENLLTTNNNLTKKFKYDSTNKFYVFA